MKKKLKQRWVAALRSGEYHQAKEYLHVPSVGYCCLGVLCDIVDDTKWVDKDRTAYTFDNNTYTYSRYPTQNWLDNVGLPDKQADYLTILNDKENQTFSQIADWIETNLQETDND
jgi:hypothetical protein